MGCGATFDPHFEQPDEEGQRPSGQTSFETPLGPSSGGGYYADPSLDSGMGSVGTGVQPPTNDSAESDDGAGNGSGQTPRLVEESDIFEIEGGLLYLLNRYRGLQIIDLTDLGAPKLIGHAPIHGYPKEMYLRDGVAYVLVSDYWNYWWRDDGLGTSFHGSQLRLIDVRDPAKPEIVGAIDLEGDCSDSRVVGDALYLVSQRNAFWTNLSSGDVTDETSVISIDLRDPGALKIADQVRFPSASWAEQHLFADEQAFVIASVSWIYDQSTSWMGAYQTKLQYVDITDPTGRIAVRGTIDLEGRVQERWAIDIHAQALDETSEPRRVLRAVSAEDWGNGDVTLATFDVTEPDAIEALGKLTLQMDEQLKSTRFDGARGYVVTFKNIDPLFAFDLSNPREPKLLGELEMPGWLDFMVPMGERVVALGRDENSRLSVSLVDVSGDAPTLLERVSVGTGWGWVPSDADDYAKIFRVFPEIGLIAFPFSHWDGESYRTMSGVQLIDLDLSADKLTERGLIASAGYVERGVLHGEARLLTLSSEIFQAVDIADRGQPKVLSTLELARHVTDFALLGDEDLAVQLSGDLDSGELALTVTTRGDPNAVTPIGRLELAAPEARLFLNGQMAWIVYRQRASPHDWQAQTAIQVVDLSAPARPRLRGKLVLPSATHGGYAWRSLDELVRASDTALAIHRQSSVGGWYLEGPIVADVAMATNTRDGDDAAPSDAIFLVDLSDPDAPRIASTIALADSEWTGSLRAQSGNLYLSDYTTAVSGGLFVARYRLRAFDVSDLDHPRALPKVSIPGWIVGMSDDGKTIYTQEAAWLGSGAIRHSLHKLSLGETSATLLGTLSLPDGLDVFHVVGDRAYATRYAYGVADSGSATNASATVDQVWRSTSELLSIDLSPDAPALLDRANIPGNGYGWLHAVAGERLYINDGSVLFIYALDETGVPSLDRFVRIQWGLQGIVVDDERAYLPSGSYGIQTIDLKSGD
jgi:hypothetical protein